ncbi:MAG: sugar ABC transporter permease, partial [Rhodococcus sp. (in: high G+C Gram-positive bacteria)]
MATVAVHRGARPLVVSTVWRTRLGYGALMAVLAYLIVLPLFRLQSLAFEDGARGYQAQYGRYDIGQTIRTTIALAVTSLAIAMVLGTVLAFAATRLPRRLSFLRIVPILPIVMPAVANVVGWAFLLSPGPGYLNALLRKLPWWNHVDSGPIDVYSTPWIIILTGFGLTSFVYLFVSAGMQNISSEHLEAAQISGSSTLGVFFRVVLPLLRP